MLNIPMSPEDRFKEENDILQISRNNVYNEEDIKNIGQTTGN